MSRSKKGDGLVLAVLALVGAWIVWARKREAAPPPQAIAVGEGGHVHLETCPPYCGGAAPPRRPQPNAPTRPRVM